MKTTLTHRMALAAVFAFAGAAVLAALAQPGQAHHSTAMFAWGDETQLQDMTVERWVWTNPHTFLYARDRNGNRWSFEGMSPNHLVRSGWSKGSLAPGERIDLTYYALRDGRHGGFNVRVKKADGTELFQLPSAR